jgi:hypothetical protein
VATLSASGFTTASYVRLLRSIKQYTPIVGSTIYTNKKVIVVDPPTFNRQFIDSNGTRILSPITSIKQVQEKQYNSGQNIISFAVSPTDFINQNIIRSMGVVDVNNIIGSPRYITSTGYSNLQSIQKDYIEYFNETVKPNDYIRFFKDLTEGPSEMADEMVPARGKLLDGIVIESSVLSRNKDRIIRRFAVDGTETKTFNAYVSGSGSSGVGAYSFEQLIEDVSLLPNSFGDTLPLDATIFITSSVQIKSSTKSSKLPSFRKVSQLLERSYVTSSILDENSSFATLEAPALDTETSVGTVSTGYPRNPFLGTPIIPTEDNTTIPLYNVEPRSSLEDVGTTSYFHKSNGIYSYDIFTKYKTEYLVKLDTDVASLLDRLYAKVTLLPINSTLSSPGRKVTSIASTQYAAGSYTTGVITMDNIFSLYHIAGTSGLRLRLYRSEADRTADSGRLFTSTPSVNAGVLFDGVLDAAGVVFPYTLIQTNNGLLYYSIDNTTASQIQSEIQLTYFTYEPISLFPTGYLPRYYKFSRDNNTALKRRNYIGCRTVNSIFDETSPVIITLATANTVVVNSSTVALAGNQGSVSVPSQINAIKFGGGGKLDVQE